MPFTPSFTDFVLATKQHKITSPRDILNEAVNRTYMIKEMVKGRDASMTVRTGRSIKDTIQLDDAGTFRFYSPHGRFDPQDTDVLQDIEVGWRFCVVHYAYSDEIISLNGGDGGSMEDVFVNLKHKYEQQCTTDLWNGMEAALWAVPVAGPMESATGTDPPAYSIPALINEYTNGLSSGFTTKLGVNPAIEERWRPQRATYNAGDPGNEDSGIIAAFDDMWLLCRYEAPDSKEAYFEDDRLRRMKILTNRDGANEYRARLRAANDRLVSPQDPAYNTPVYSGIPVKYVSTLDTALLDITNGTAWAEGEPRYLWLNLEYLFPIWHSQGYMQQVGPLNSRESPFSHAVYKRTWYNLFARSMQRHGIVYPAA